jgi:lipopolysaccharide export system permease protein
MSTCEMLRIIREAEREHREARRDRVDLLRSDLRSLLALPADPVPPPAEPLRPLPLYCRAFELAGSLILPKTLDAQSAALDGGNAGAVDPPQEEARRTRPPRNAALSNWSLTATAVDRVEDSHRRAARFGVEVHKKWSISYACISFVIIGIVMALRFPRGGIGLVIGGGLLLFSVHYVGLTMGESLADRGHVEPWLAMWLPNIVLTVLGVLGLVRVSRESGSTRGGDFQEVIDGARHLVRRLRKLRLPAWRRT